MHHATLLASVFGPFMFVIGLWVLLRKHDVEKVWTSIKATPGLLYVGGVINLLIGFTVLAMYKEWSMHLAVLVTLFGYVQLLRGLSILFAHDWAMKMSTKIMKHRQCHLCGILPIVWGIALMCVACCG